MAAVAARPRAAGSRRSRGACAVDLSGHPWGKMPLTDRYGGVTDEGPPLRPEVLSATVLAVLCRSSGEIRPDPLLDAVDAHVPAVGEDPLRAGVSEGHADHHHGVGVVAVHRLDRDVALRGAVRGPV